MVPGSSGPSCPRRRRPAPPACTASSCRPWCRAGCGGGAVKLVERVRPGRLRRASCLPRRRRLCLGLSAGGSQARRPSCRRFRIDRAASSTASHGGRRSRSQSRSRSRRCTSEWRASVDVWGWCWGWLTKLTGPWRRYHLSTTSIGARSHRRGRRGMARLRRGRAR